jgi:hypothetical protein
MLQSILDAVSAAAPRIGPHDVAAGIRENVINAYANAHHRSEHPKPHNPYKGAGEINDLRLGYEYDIVKPAVFDLSPTANFSDLMTRWLLRQPELLQQRSTEGLRELINTPQPNLKIQVPDLSLTLIMHTINKKLTIDFSISIACFVTTDSANQIRITPVSAHVDDPRALENAVVAAANREAYL